MPELSGRRVLQRGYMQWLRVDLLDRLLLRADLQRSFARRLRRRWRRLRRMRHDEGRHLLGDRRMPVRNSRALRGRAGLRRWKVRVQRQLVSHRMLLGDDVRRARPHPLRLGRRRLHHVRPQESRRLYQGRLQLR